MHHVCATTTSNLRVQKPFSLPGGNQGDAETAAEHAPTELLGAGDIHDRIMQLEAAIQKHTRIITGILKKHGL